jgi:hypothetical protein
MLGEARSTPGNDEAPVVRVIWLEDGKVMTELKPVLVTSEAVDMWRAAGWNVFTLDDPDDWLRSLVS